MLRPPALLTAIAATAPLTTLATHGFPFTLPKSTLKGAVGGLKGLIKKPKFP